MFGFSRPTHLYVDPWGRGGYVVPDDLYAGQAAPFGFLDKELPCECPSCCPEDFYDAYARPYTRAYQHPNPANHRRRQQQHPFFGLSHPQQTELLRRAHPSAYTAKMYAPAAAGWHPHCDVQPEQVEEPAALLYEGSPFTAPRDSSSRPASSHSRGSSSTVRPHLAPVYQDNPSCRMHPTPFAVPVQQHQQHQQQPASPAASVASSRGRHSIPVVAGSPHPAAPEQVQEQHVSPARAPVQFAAAPQQLQQQHVQQTQGRPACRLSRAEAATVIQSWWRMRRLARQRPALQALAAAAAQLRSTSSLFQSYKDDSSAAGCRQHAQQRQHISHKQYLELNELAMRVLLALDATSCGVAELRAVRKRLTASAINLLDDIQASYSAAVNASMELSDDVVLAAVQQLAKPAVAAAAAAADQQQQQQQQHQSQQCIQQQQQQQGQPECLAPLPQGDDAARQELQVAEEEQLQHMHQPAGELTGDVQQQRQACIESQQTAQNAAVHSTEGDDSLAVLSEQLAAVPQQQQQQQQQQQSEVPSQQVLPLELPAGVRVVLVYPGSRADAATQAD